MRKQSLPPKIDKKTVRVLILGTFPGEESLRKREYYGNNRNTFWEIIFRVLKKKDPYVYCERIEILKKAGIGLWDIIKSCEREGSADSEIKEAVVNKLEKINNCSQLKTICFNGQKAEHLFKRHYDLLDLKEKVLPSTSPAYAGMSIGEKIQKWKIIRSN